MEILWQTSRYLYLKSYFHTVHSFLSPTFYSLQLISQSWSIATKTSLCQVLFPHRVQINIFKRLTPVKKQPTSLKLYMYGSSLVPFSSDFLIAIYFQIYFLQNLKLQKFTLHQWCDGLLFKREVSPLLHRMFWSKFSWSKSFTWLGLKSMNFPHLRHVLFLQKHHTQSFLVMWKIILIWRKIGRELNWSCNKNQEFTTLC